MALRVLATILSLLFSTTLLADEKWDPVADPASVVTVGNARFSVLTPGLVRMEWAADGKFEDRASQVFVNRRIPDVKYVATDSDGVITIATEKVEIRYRKDGGRFENGNLMIVGRTGPGDKTVDLAPPFENHGNLGGTTRTLDGVNGSCPLENGLLSREGWTLIDDSQRLMLTDGDPPWTCAREKKDAIDWYLFVYGHDYKAALGDFIKVAGRIPLPPRFAFGAWWSRYWDYSADELKQLVKEFREHDVPLDVLVVDMGWHLDGWTGYTWNPKYFPDPAGFLKWAHGEGLKVTLNLHPAEGVGKQEKQFGEMCKAMGQDAKKTERVPFDCADRKFVEAYFNVLHRPLEQQGVDFWWIDWQQGKKTSIAGLDPLWWLNYLHWNDMQRRAEETGKRPMLFSRWGGLGNHRYQIGFSGDTYSTWRSLAFQPYFTATAGNVGYAYWSHDIGGHMPGKVDPELYVRWLQWGALSPIMRTHTTKNPDAERRIWEFPKEYFEAGREAYQLRYQLIPYIYTAARQCYDTGVPLCRPLYLEWPDEDEAYKHGGEYMFGDELLVAPVTEPCEPVSGCAMVEVWLPPGKWTNWFTGRVYEGPKTIPVVVTLRDIPIFVKWGGIVATQVKMSRSGEGFINPIILNVLLGESGKSELYEDDGNTNGYVRGGCTWTSVSQKVFNDTRFVTIEPSSGSYPGIPTARRLKVVMPDGPPPSTGLVGNASDQRIMITPSVPEFDGPIPYTPEWGTIDCESIPVAEKTEIEFNYWARSELKSPQRLPPFDGGRGYLRMYIRALVDHSEVEIPFDPENPGPWANELKRANSFEQLWSKLIHLVASAEKNKADRTKTLIRLLGLYYKLALSTNDARSFDADIRLTSTHNIPVTDKIGGKIRYLPDGRFVPKGEGEREFHGLTDDKPVSLTMRIENKYPLETTVVRAEIEIKNEGMNFTIPLETIVLPSVNAWWIAGPFETEFKGALAREFAPEKGEFDPGASLKGKEGKAIGWKRFERKLVREGNHAPTDEMSDEFYVDFKDVFGQRVNDCVVYAFTYLEAPEDMVATLALGSDDGVAVWVNGKEVHRNDVARSYASKEDHATVHLKKGENSLLVKISQGGGDGGFCVHVEDDKGKPMTKVKAKMER